MARRLHALILCMFIFHAGCVAQLQGLALNIRLVNPSAVPERQQMPAANQTPIASRQIIELQVN